MDITETLQEQNLLCVTVDNSENDRVYPQKADFTFYGGIYRDVNLIIVSKYHFDMDHFGGPGIKVTAKPTENYTCSEIVVETWRNCDTGQVHIAILDAEGKEAGSADMPSVKLSLPNVRLWNGVKDPYLYTATATLTVNGETVDQISTRFGIRDFFVDSSEGFFLNGRSYPLHGVSRHQDWKGIGNAITKEHHDTDMALIQEIGANTIRLAHYQHSRYFYDLCDRKGLIVWAEIPYISVHMPGGRANTVSQMRELIAQNYNHPSIVCWGLSNEITASGQVTEDLMDNHRQLNKLCHAMDPTRPTTMAHAFMLEIDSPLIPIADLASYNLYFGWYLGDLEQNDSFFDEYHEKFPDRCIGFSEYGADANPQFQDARPEKGDYTESYQCVYHEHILNCIDQRPWMWATHVWNLFDFAADGRDEGGKHGVNQKGLVTMDRKLKKDAFYLYKAAWNKTEPFVHLCGRRYVDRPEAETEVKVYSNQNQVTLLVDGKPLDTKTGSRVFTFQVPLSGEHSIKAIAGECKDTMTIRKVEQPNPAYSFVQKGDVVNWFDKESFKADCYSIQDTLGELLDHPEAGKLVQEIMDRVHSSRGDVAKSTANNANLQKMLRGMKFEGLLKQAGKVISGEQIVELNRTLQAISKA